MKILHITPSYKPAYIYGGPIISVARLCEALVKRNEQGTKSKEQGGENLNLKVESERTTAEVNKLAEKYFDLQVLTTTANGKGELLVKLEKPTFIDGVQVTYFNRLTKDHSHFSPNLLWALRKKILRCAQDDKIVIHIHAWWNLVSVFSCLIAKWYNVPVVLSPRGMLTAYSQTHNNSFSKKLIHHLIGRRLLEYCHIHATSMQEEKEILAIVQPKSIAVIWNLVSMAYQVLSFKYQEVHKIESLEPKANNTVQIVGSRKEYQDSSIKIPNAEEPFKLIFLSRIEEKKGLGLLFDALASLEIEWMLTIAGSGEHAYVESLKQRVKSLKLSSRINWIGQVSNEDKFGILSQHDLLVLPSYNENFANVVVESLSVGTPVLISEQVGLADYVKANNMGWVTGLVVEDIKDKMILAFQAVEHRTKIRNHSPQQIREDFDDEILAEKYIELYERVLQVQNH